MTDKMRDIIFGVLTGLVSIGFLFGAYANMTGDAAIQEGLAEVGWGEYQTQLGMAMLIYVVAFLIPQTRKVGFALMSAHLAGAMAIEIAQGQVPPMPPIIMNVMLWVGMYLKYPDVFKVASTGEDES